jgi:hypothetical protein
VSINAQTGWRFGTTGLAAATFAGLSIAADVLAIVLWGGIVHVYTPGDCGIIDEKTRRFQLYLAEGVAVEAQRFERTAVHLGLSPI